MEWSTLLTNSADDHSADDDHRPDHVGIEFWRVFRAYEARMYEALHAHVPDLTVISIGHRPSLRRFHAMQLHFTAAESAASPATAKLNRIQIDESETLQPDSAGQS